MKTLLFAFALISCSAAAGQRFPVTCGPQPVAGDGWQPIGTAPHDVPVRFRAMTPFGHAPINSGDLWRFVPDSSTPLGGWWEPLIQTVPPTKVPPNAPGCLYWKPAA